MIIINKVVIVGCGNVGMSYAYCLVNGKYNLKELILIDLDRNKVEGEVEDLKHASAYSSSHLEIKVGDYSECKDATLVCLAAGVNQKKGETRLDLLNNNINIFKDIISKINESGFKGIYLVATNPVDILSFVTYKLSGFSFKRVIGSGTTLDSARLKSILADKYLVNPESVHAYVIGEHGDSEVIPFSKATIGLNNLKLTKKEKEEISYKVRNSAYQIIEKKGSTCYGIGVCLAKITNAILNDTHQVMSVSSYNKEHDCYFGIPSIITKKGILKSFYVELNKEEEKLLSQSILVLKETINNCFKLEKYPNNNIGDFY